MPLTDTLQTDLVTAIKAGDAVAKSTIRSVITAVKTAEADEGGGGPLSDDAVLKLIAIQVKQRTEAAEIFEGAGEQERADKEIAERVVLQGYLPDLPEPLSEEELEALVADVIAQGGYSSKKDMGAAIKDVMARADGRVDGRRVSAVVGPALAG